MAYNGLTHSLASASTNVAKALLWLLIKYFPRSHKLHKLFYRSTVKVSYSCISNISKFTKGHNKKVTSKSRNQRPKFNCKRKAEFLMEWKCQVDDVVYKCDVQDHCRKKCILDLQRQNRRAVSITTIHHLNRRDIPIRQQFQVTCGTWKVF